MRTVLALLGGVLLWSSAQASVTTLNFDEPVSLDITHAYSGVTFSAPFPGTGPVRTYDAGSAFVSADTPANVLGLSGSPNFVGFNQSNGAIDVVFDTPVSFVSIRASLLQLNSNAFTYYGVAFMSVYNSSTPSSSSRLGQVLWDVPSDPCIVSGNLCQTAYETLAFTSSSADIKSIRLSGQYDVNSNAAERFATFDTLAYGSMVPEPSASYLMILGGAALAWVVRKRGVANPVRMPALA